MVGNVASIFTQVYIAKATSIYSFFPHLLHAVPLTSLSLLSAHVDIFMVFSFAAVTGPMYSGASAFLFLDTNPAIIPTAISSEKSR